MYLPRNAPLVETLVVIGAGHVQGRPVHVQTVTIPRAVRARDIDTLGADIETSLIRAASQCTNKGLILLAGAAPEILKDDIGDGQGARVLQAERQVLLAVALVDLDGVVDVVDHHAAIGDVADAAVATAALQVARERRGRVGPHLDSRAVGRVVHRHVAHPDVLDDVVRAGVLAQRPDADAVRAVAEEVLH